jgi:hypothetical protein
MDMSESAALRPYLQPGEGLLWWGRPRQGFMLTARDVLLVPFSLAWGGFAIFWETLVVSGDDPSVLFALWGVPFVLIGLYMIAGRFFHDAWKRSRTIYGLTAQRALILRGDRFSALPLADAGKIRLQGGADGGRGTIVFGADPPLTELGIRHNLTGWTPSDAGPTFLGIEGAQRVFNLIQSTRAKAAS